MSDLPAQYHAFMADIIDEKGVGLTKAMIVDGDGKMTLMALDLEPEQIYRVVLAEIAKGASEAIFALDRFTRPSQGTRYADVLAGFYYAGPAMTADASAFRPFVIEYRHAPRIVEPICWDNPFWNETLRGELAKIAAGMLSAGGASA